MISNILSKLFKLGFILSLIGGLAAIYGQVMQKQFRIKTGKNGFFSIGQPGIRVNARRDNSFEKAAPDTTIKYMFRDSNGRMTTSSDVILNGEAPFNGLFNSSKELEKLLAEKKGSNEKLEIDSTITIIGQANYNMLLEEKGSSYETRDDSTVKYSGGSGSPILFKDMAAAEKYDLLRLYGPVNRISQENNITEVLRIMPANGWQHAGFVLYDIIQFSCSALLLLCLASLFRNFSKKMFFTKANVILLKRTGLLLLIPSLAAALLYWIFLVHIHPVKLVLANEANTAMVANYEIAAGTDWTLIFLGAGLLVLGYIFNNGLALKEEQALTI